MINYDKPGRPGASNFFGLKKPLVPARSPRCFESFGGSKRWKIFKHLQTLGCIGCERSYAKGGTGKIGRCMWVHFYELRNCNKIIIVIVLQFPAAYPWAMVRPLCGVLVASLCCLNMFKPTVANQIGLLVSHPIVSRTPGLIPAIPASAWPECAAWFLINMYALW